MKTIDDVNCLLFANYLVIWTKAPKQKAESTIKHRLNSTLVILSIWCTENNMIINLEKTAVQSFSLTHREFSPDLSHRNKALTQTNRFNYLEVTFNNKLNGNHTCNLYRAAF